jgi:plasmid replication initiation protein
VLAADVDYWITATPEEVRKFLRENTNIKDYEQKKKQLLCEIEMRKSKS